MNRSNGASRQVRNSSNRRSRSRMGGAAIELAVTFPILLSLLFAGIEIARANLVRNASEQAALCGAREGIVPGATAQACIDAANGQLDLLGIQGASVSVEPAVIEHTTETVTVTVTVSLTDNALPMSKFVLGKTMIKSFTLPREIDND